MSQTPEFIGQTYKDTVRGNVWKANSLTPGDWSKDVQDMQVDWTPTNVTLWVSASFNMIEDVPGLDTLTLRQPQMVSWIDIEYQTTLTSVSIPNLTSTNSYVLFTYCNLLNSISAPVLSTLGGLLSVESCPIIASVNFPSLTSVTGKIYLDSNDSLTSISLPSLIDALAGIDASANPLLTTVDFTSFVPTNGQNYDFSGCALTATSVNQLLARCVANAGFVSGLIKTSGGTSAAPTGQGAADKITLNARQAGLAVTN